MIPLPKGPEGRRFRPGCRGLGAAIVGAGLSAVCGSSAFEPTPQPTPTPAQDTWYTFVVQCSNCPGLTNAQIDRTVTPYRARLRVGQRTSLRAAVREPCEPVQDSLEINRWIAGNGQVVQVEPSSLESAIVTALAPGTSSITVERRFPDGTLNQKNLADAQSTSGCGPLPELVFEIVP